MSDLKLRNNHNRSRSPGNSGGELPQQVDVSGLRAGPSFASSFHKRYRSENPGRKPILRSSPTNDTSEAPFGGADRLNHLMELIKNQDNKQQRIFNIEEARLMNKSGNKDAPLNIGSLYDHFDKVRGLFKLRKERTDQMGKGGQGEDLGQLRHVESVQQMQGETIDSQAGEDRADMAGQNGMIKSRGKKHALDEYAHHFRTLADAPQSTRHFSNKHFSVGGIRAASRPRPIDRDTGAVREMDPGFSAIRSPVDASRPRDRGDGKLPTIRGASFFEKNFGAANGGLRGDVGVGGSFSTKSHYASPRYRGHEGLNSHSIEHPTRIGEQRGLAPSHSSRQQLPYDHDITSPVKSGRGLNLGSQGRTVGHSLADISNQKSSMASLNVSLGGQTAVNYGNFRLQTNKFSNERKGNKISLTGGLSSQQKAMQDVLSLREHKARHEQGLKEIESMQSLIDSLGQSQSKRVLTQLSRQVQNITNQQHSSAKPMVGHDMLQDHVSRGAADIATLGQSLHKSIQKNINAMSIKQIPINGHVNGEKSLGDNQKLIMNKFIEASEGEAADFSLRRNRVDNLQKHRKAMALLQEIEGGGKKNTKNQSSPTATISGQQSPDTNTSRHATQKTTAFAEQYGEFHDEHDTDVAEAQIFKNLDSHEEGNKQRGSTKRSSKLPEIIQPYKGTKFEKRISPTPSFVIKETKTVKGEQADGTFDFTAQEQERINERKKMVLANIKQKDDFKKDVSQIVTQANMIQDFSTYDPEAGVVTKQPIYKTMDREGASELFKQDFAVKTSKMNERIGLEMEEADKQIGNMARIAQPEPTPQEILKGGKEMGQSQKEGRPRQSPLSTKGSPSVTAGRQSSVSPSQSNRSPAERARKIHEALSPRSARKTVGAEAAGWQAEQSATSPGLRSPGRKTGTLGHKEQTKLEKAPPAFRKMLAPSIRNRERELRKEKRRQTRSPDRESEESTGQSHETPAQAKKRLLFEELRILQALPRSQRKQALLDRIPPADLGPEEEERQDKLKLFLTKINGDEGYPLETIKNLLLMKAQEYEYKKDNAFGDAALAKGFSADDLIEGLCLLQCLKNEETKANAQKEQNKEPVVKSSKMVLRGAKTIRSFSNAQGDDHYFVNKKRTADMRELTKGRGHGADGRAATPGSDGAEADNKQRAKYLDDLFETGFFQDVINTILGSNQYQIAYEPQADKKLSAGVREKTQTSPTTEPASTARAAKKNWTRVKSKLLPVNPAAQLVGLVGAAVRGAGATRQVLDYAKINRTDQSLQMYARQVNLQHEFFQICKFADDPRVQRDLETNPIMQYFQTCRQNNALSLPILNRISGKVFPLLNYKISASICESLGAAFKSNKNLINSIVLANNGLKDADFSQILEGLRGLSHVKSIVYKQNEIGPKAFASLLPLLRRRKPMHLAELKILNCKMTNNVTTELLEELNRGSTLAKLSLVGASFTSASWGQLCHLLEKNRNLKELDISYNDIPLHSMLQFARVLGKDRKLISLDLSWNSLALRQPVTRIGEMESRGTTLIKSAIDGIRAGQRLFLEERARKEEEAQRQEITARGLAEEAKKAAQEGEATKEGKGKGRGQEDAGKANISVAKQEAPADARADAGAEQPASSVPSQPNAADMLKAAAQEAIDEQNAEVAEHLCHFIKYNQNLYHLNLSNTQLDADMLRKVTDSMNKARSLVSLHLSGNPGINEENIQFIRKHIVCKSARKAVEIRFPEQDKALKNSNSVSDIQLQTENMDSEQRRRVMQENLKLRQIRQSLSIQKLVVPIEDDEQITLEVVRALGHRWEMPTSQQWQLYTNFFSMSEYIGKLTFAPAEREADQQGEGDALAVSPERDSEGSCWICEKKIYALVFWSESIGFHAAEQLDPKTKKTIVDQIRSNYSTVSPINTDNPQSTIEKRWADLLTMYDDDAIRPLISGEFNNWEPLRMLRVDEFAQSLDAEGRDQAQDYFDVLRDTRELDPALKTKRFSCLPGSEQNLYQDYKAATMARYNAQWAQILGNQIRYKKPYVCNGHLLNTVQHPHEEQLYVYPCFMKPGKQRYVIIRKENLANNMLEAQELPESLESYYIHKEIADNRDEEIVPHYKKMKNKQKERSFDHASSVFKGWTPDNATTLEKCLDHDFKQWKVPNFVKDPDELEAVKKVIAGKFPVLKDIYHHLVAASNWPGIGWLDFTAWTSAVRIPEDKRGVPQSAVDMAFKAAVYQEKSKLVEGSNPENALCRFEFLEGVVRLAKAKYLQTGVEKTYAKATALLISENLVKHNPCEPWQGFRAASLWTMEVNDLMEPNIPGLKTVYESYFEARKKAMDKADVIRLLTVDTELFAQEKDAIYCYGMSKMTCVVESVGSDKSYGLMKFSEFLELMGRAAQLKYAPASDQPEAAAMSFPQKLEYVLDAVLATKGLQRLDPQITVVDESEPDSDY